MAVGRRFRLDRGGRCEYCTEGGSDCLCADDVGSPMRVVLTAIMFPGRSSSYSVWCRSATCCSDSLAATRADVTAPDELQHGWFATAAVSRRRVDEGWEGWRS